ncbi:MAG: outer membrane beta-barrel protein [Bacteroidetes bacterium]|nr:outer membrane beta-barrel protein [Bacteroidota bacterium]
MKRLVCVLAVFVFLGATAAEAQYYRFGPRPRRYREQRAEYFQPVVHLNLGYGFPNLDKYVLPDFYHADMGSPSYTGPLTASVDYQFSRRMGIGVLVTHGTVSAPYYDYSNPTNTPDFKGHLNNTAVMLDLVRYIPAGPVVTPYFRTAIGVNIWQQSYTDASGAQVADGGDLPALAYQVSLGANFKLSKQAGLFIEAGYGKYILNGGLALAFK